MDPNMAQQQDIFSSVLDNIYNSGSYIPRAMLIFAFVASLILTILKIIEIVNRRSKLEFKITRDFFLRIFDCGECFYTNAVLVAYNAGALIENVEVKLKKENGVTKSFNLDVVNFGEKVRSEDGFSRYYFHSPSPVCFVPDSMPQRITYLCSQGHYAEQIRKTYSDFSTGILEIKHKYSQAMEKSEEEQLAKAGQEVISVIKDTSSKIMDSVQIEPGSYQIIIKVCYRQRGRFLPVYRSKRAKSSLKFVVETNVRDVLRWQIHQYVEILARSLLFDEKPPLITPEYAPVRIKEVL